MRGLAFGALAVALAAASPAGANTLWRDAKAGETPAQILSRISDAKHNPDPSNIKGSAWCDVHIPRVQFASRDFEACFYFENDKLTQVSLDAQAGMKGPASGQAAFDTTLTSLRSQYGVETSLEKNSGSLTRANAKWTLPRRSIELFMMVYGEDGDVNLKIHFRPPTS